MPGKPTQPTDCRPSEGAALGVSITARGGARRGAGFRHVLALLLRCTSRFAVTKIVDRL